MGQHTQDDAIEVISPELLSEIAGGGVFKISPDEGNPVGAPTVPGGGP
jgi:hypothetical protein